MSQRICLNQSVLDFMASQLTRESFVLEFGAGWSSRWFAARCGKLVSVETDPEWMRRVIESLTGCSTCDWSVIMPRAPDALPVMLRNDGQPDLILMDCDEVLRETYTRLSWPYLKPGGWFVFDDAQRLRHGEAVRWLTALAGSATRLEWQPGDIETARERLALAFQRPSVSPES